MKLSFNWGPLNQRFTILELSIGWEEYKTLIFSLCTGLWYFNINFNWGSEKSYL